MPQVLGTMRSRAPEEGENSLPMGSSRLERRLAGWKITAWISSCTLAVYWEKSYELPASPAQGKVPRTQVTSPSGGGSLQGTVLTPAPLHCAWWRSKIFAK